MSTPQAIPLRIPGYRHIQNGHPISRLEGNGNYTLMHLQGGLKPLLVSQTLKRFEGHFPAFIRISKSMMINPHYVDTVIQKNHKLLYLTLTNGPRLLVSRRRILDTLVRLGRL